MDQTTGGGCKEITVAAVGDVYIKKDARVATERKNRSTLLAEVGPLLSAADVCLYNVEGPMVESHGAPIAEKCCIRSVPRAAQWLAEIAPCVAILANNHSCDYGADALQRTRTEFSRHGAITIGAGLNLAEATAPCIMKVQGVRLGLVAFAWDFIGAQAATQDSFGVAPLDEDLIAASIDGLKEVSDCIVISVHWGYEKERYPLPWQRELAHRMIDRGATVVVGHHPHVYQGVEQYRNGLIAYSLGNFVFPDISYGPYEIRQNEATRSGLMLSVNLNATGVTHWQITPLRADRNFHPTVLSGVKRSLVLQHVNDLSSGFGVRNYRAFWRKNRSRRDLIEIRHCNSISHARLRFHRTLHRVVHAFETT